MIGAAVNLFISSTYTTFLFFISISLTSLVYSHDRNLLKLKPLNQHVINLRLHERIPINFQQKPDFIEAKDQTIFNSLTRYASFMFNTENNFNVVKIIHDGNLIQTTKSTNNETENITALLSVPNGLRLVEMGKHGNKLINCHSTTSRSAIDYFRNLFFKSVPEENRENIQVGLYSFGHNDDKTLDTDSSRQETLAKADEYRTEKDKEDEKEFVQIMELQEKTQQNPSEFNESENNHDHLEMRRSQKLENENNDDKDIITTTIHNAINNFKLVKDVYSDKYLCTQMNPNDETTALPSTNPVSTPTNVDKESISQENLAASRQVYSIENELHHHNYCLNECTKTQSHSNGNDNYHFEIDLSSKEENVIYLTPKETQCYLSCQPTSPSQSSPIETISPRSSSIPINSVTPTPHIRPSVISDTPNVKDSKHTMSSDDKGVESHLSDPSGSYVETKPSPATGKGTRIRMREKSKSRQKRQLMTGWMIFPGTKWCGDGDIADHRDDLGYHSQVDTCCKVHDLCPATISKFTRAYGLFNYRPLTISHCRCDRRFRKCLQATETPVSSMVGRIFFNVIGPVCFKLRKESACTERHWWGTCKKWGVTKVAYIKPQRRYRSAAVEQMRNKQKQEQLKAIELKEQQKLKEKELKEQQELQKIELKKNKKLQQIEMKKQRKLQQIEIRRAHKLKEKQLKKEKKLKQKELKKKQKLLEKELARKNNLTKKESKNLRSNDTKSRKQKKDRKNRIKSRKQKQRRERRRRRKLIRKQKKLNLNKRNKTVSENETENETIRDTT